MPKRQIAIPEFPEALAAIKEALKHPRILTLEEERDFLERRSKGWIERHEYVVTERRGKLVYRSHGKAGADLPVPPYYWDLLKRQRDFEAEASKVERLLRLRYSRTGRRSAAKQLEQRIIELAAVDLARGRIKRIARQTGCSVATVKRALLAERKGSRRK